jgi:P27 family predicted phage terminase small subunit
MRGRKPYPLQIIDATNDKNRYTKEVLASRAKNEPKIKSNFMRCPTHLSDDAKKEWRRIVKLYGEFEQPLLSDLDVNALEVYCEAVVTYRKAMLKVHETAEVYTSSADRNRPKKNPWMTIANEAAATIKKYGEVLLLDPVSRARAGMAKKENEENLSPMEAFMKRRNDNGTQY